MMIGSFVWLTAAVFGGDAHACGFCGSGYTDYYAWECDEDDEYVPVVVGRAAWASSCSSTSTLLWGRVTSWYLTVRSAPKGVDPEVCVVETPAPNPPILWCPGDVEDPPVWRL
ncbi:MAG: hypothetical protein ABMB14_29860 [Myxococcota bacterium]